MSDPNNLDRNGDRLRDRRDGVHRVEIMGVTVPRPKGRGFSRNQGEAH